MQLSLFLPCRVARELFAPWRRLSSDEIPPNRSGARDGEGAGAGATPLEPPQCDHLVALVSEAENLLLRLRRPEVLVGVGSAAARLLGLALRKLFGYLLGLRDRCELLFVLRAQRIGQSEELASLDHTSKRTAPLAHPHLGGVGQAHELIAHDADLGHEWFVDHRRLHVLLKLTVLQRLPQIGLLGRRLGSARRLRLRLIERLCLQVMLYCRCLTPLLLDTLHTPRVCLQVLRAHRLPLAIPIHPNVLHKP